jgi:hypothetical protein
MATGYAASTLRGAARVATVFPPEERDPDLPFYHYREVMGLPAPARTRLLKEAKESELTNHELRDKVRAERSKVIQQVERVRAAAVPEAERQTWPVIIADPPWSDMALEDICDTPVPAGLHCALFLWAPVERLPEALSVCTAWGYDYKAHVVWPSTRQEGASLGTWVHAEHELVLVGGKGDMAPAEKPGTLLSPGGDMHHRQLDELVERMYPGLPRHKMFDKVETYA